jgi:HAD superfamily hydrolase (TIGR01549 family)
MKKLTGIKVIIWDFDQTLYSEIPPLKVEFNKALMQVLSHHMPQDETILRQKFESLHPAVYPSDTKTLSVMCNIPLTDAARELELYFDRIKYLKYDPKLVTLFNKLKGYQHYILTNGIIEKVSLSLKKLGLSPQIFTEIISSETVGVNKPDLAGFNYILNHTGYAPSAHLMVGDRDSVDLRPAQLLGIKTCFVWGESEIADVSVPTVYDVENVVL